MSTETATAEIDFSRYRRPELTEHISSLISLPGVVRTIVLSMVLSVVVTWVAIGVVAYATSMHWFFVLISFAYSSLAALLGGALIGAFRVVWRSLDSMVGVVDLTLEISENVAADVTDMSSGTKSIPSPWQIIDGVYDQVMLPAIEGAVRGQSRLLGGLLFGVYHWSIGRVIKRLLRKTPHDADIEQKVADQADIPANEIDSEQAASTWHSWIGDVRSYLTRTGSTIRGVVMTPLSIMLAIMLAVMIAPLAIIIWLG